MALGTLTVNLVARIADFLRAFGVASRTVDKFVVTATRMLSRFNLELAAMGVAVTAVGVIIGKAFSKAVGAAKDFQQNMANVSTLVIDDVNTAADEVRQHMENFEKGVLKLAVTFGESTKVVTKGLYDILSATIAPADALKVLAISMRAARAGLSDTATAAKGIVSILLSYGYEARQAARVSDLLFAAVRRGVVTFGELAPRIGRVATTAAIAGISLEELLATFTTLTRAGLDVGFATTSINQTLKAFLAPSNAARRAAMKYNMILDTTTLRQEGLLGVMERLVELLPEQTAQMFRNIRALRGINAAIQQVTGYAEDYNIMMADSSETQRAFVKQTKTLQFTLDRLSAAWEVFRIKAGTPVLKLLKVMGEALVSVVEAFNRIPEPLREFIVLATALTGILAAIVGPLMIVVALLGALGISAGTVVAVIAGLVVAGTGLAAALMSVEEKTKDATDAQEDLIRVQGESQEETEKQVGWFKKLVDLLTQIPGPLRFIAAVVNEVMTPSWDNAEESAKMLAKAVKEVTESLDDQTTPTVEVERKWRGMLELLRRGVPINEEVQAALEGLAEVLGTTRKYTEETREEWLKHINALLEASSQYDEIYQILDQGGEITEKQLEQLKELEVNLGKQSDEVERSREYWMKLIKEWQSSISSLDLIRKQMDEAVQAFIRQRYAAQRLEGAYQDLGVTAPDALRLTAEVAVESFKYIRDHGKLAAEELREVWIEGVIPKLQDAWGKIPDYLATMHRRLVGETAALTNLFAALGMDLQAQMEKNAREMIRYFQEILEDPERAGLSVEKFREVFGAVKDEVVRTFGVLPEDFRSIYEEVTGETLEIGNAFERLNKKSSAEMKALADASWEAFREIYAAAEDLGIPEERLRDLWRSVVKVIEGAYDELDKEQQEVQDHLIESVKAAAEGERMIRENTIIGLWQEWEERKEFYQKIEDADKRSMVLRIANRLQEQEVWEAVYEQIAGKYEEHLDRIVEMQGLSVNTRIGKLEELLEEMRELGLEGTEIYAEYLDTIETLTDEKADSITDIWDRTWKSFQRSATRSLRNIILGQDKASETSYALFKKRLEDQKEDLKKRLEEGRIDQERYYLEVENLAQRAEKRKREEAAFTVRFLRQVWEELKKAFATLLADMLVTFIATELKKLAIVKAIEKLIGVERQKSAGAGAGAGAEGGLLGGLTGGHILGLLLIGGMIYAAHRRTKAQQSGGQVTSFQEGGIITKPTLALAGEGGPEAIIPLDKAGRSDFGGKEVNVTFQGDAFDMKGAMIMSDDEATVDRFYRDIWLPAKRRRLETLKDVINEEVD